MFGSSLCITRITTSNYTTSIHQYSFSALPPFQLPHISVMPFPLILSRPAPTTSAHISILNMAPPVGQVPGSFWYPLGHLMLSNVSITRTHSQLAIQTTKLPSLALSQPPAASLAAQLKNTDLPAPLSLSHLLSLHS